ncbi:hypothetical protein [Bifidobacterium myosotis]|uniref:Uncharacterized protein n=1 Tax=Bifidobacterium myosotis TaxID=1630166 RepID=A0A5M9ZG01_9BIFI|nr:hypothetical protein [Bifidobacterium myosotis]KAA8825114.1 hypothetical protein EMO91_12865 [Bifidobacterium myosotis]
MTTDANGRSHRPQGLPQHVAGTFDAKGGDAGATDVEPPAAPPFDPETEWRAETATLARAADRTAPMDDEPVWMLGDPEHPIAVPDSIIRSRYGRDGDPRLHRIAARAWALRQAEPLRSKVLADIAEHGTDAEWMRIHARAVMGYLRAAPDATPGPTPADKPADAGPAAAPDTDDPWATTETGIDPETLDRPAAERAKAAPDPDPRAAARRERAAAHRAWVRSRPVWRGELDAATLGDFIRPGIDVNHTFAPFRVTAHDGRLIIASRDMDEKGRRRLYETWDPLVPDLKDGQTIEADGDGVWHLTHDPADEPKRKPKTRESREEPKTTKPDGEPEAKDAPRRDTATRDDARRTRYDPYDPYDPYRGMGERDWRRERRLQAIIAVIRGLSALIGAITQGYRQGRGGRR